MYLKLCFFLGMFHLAQAAVADTDPGRRVLRGANDGHTFVVALAKKAFQPRDHHIRRRADDLFVIDGRKAQGVEVYLPREELAYFTVTVDGKRWRVPDRLWRDCFEPHFGDTVTPPASYIHAWVFKDGKRCTVKMEGSDGAGGYTVVWRLRKSGRHARTVEYG